jgi:hypothetical protein
MQPMVILLLGALAPNTEEGTIVGKAMPAAAMAEFFRKSRRDIMLLIVGFLLIIASPV